jgi:hypothetical protein
VRDGKGSLTRMSHWARGAKLWLARTPGASVLSGRARRTRNEEGNPLRTLLYREVKAATERTIQASGQVSLDQVEGLSRLARLVDISEAAYQSRARHLWTVLAAIAVTLGIISLLFFVRVRETSIEMQLAVSAVAFVLQAEGMLVEKVDASEFGAVGLSEVHFRGQAHQASAIKLSSRQGHEQESVITLAELSAPAGTHVRLTKTDVPNQYRVLLEGTEDIALSAKVIVSGPVDVILLPPVEVKPFEEFNAYSPEHMNLKAESKAVHFDVTPRPPKVELSSLPLQVSNLSLFRVLGGEGRLRRMSSIFDGSMVLEEVDRKTYKLRPTDDIRFEGTIGQIWGHGVQDGQIALKYHGRAQRLRIGSEESPTDLMPRLVEWLSARYPISLLWGLAGYVFLVVRFVFGGWRRVG